MTPSIISRICMAMSLLCTSPVIAQEVHFIPFDAAPMSINPAYTGMFDGNVRVSLGYQNEWTATTVPYITYVAGADMPVFIDAKGNYLATGIQCIKDDAGDNNINDFYAAASLAYHKLLGQANSAKRSDLSFGIQGAYSQKNIDLTTLYFNPGYVSYYNPASPNYPLGVGADVSNYFINAGISFSQALTGKLSYTAGISANNINQPTTPKEQLSNQQLGNERNFYGTLGANWLISNRLALRPALLYQVVQNENNKNELIAGTELAYTLGKQHTNSIFIGSWYRTSVAYQFLAGADIKRIRISAAFDYGNTQPNSGMNGFTIQLRYVAPGKPAKDHKHIVPCNRF